MIYVYDIIVNLNDEIRDFYDWQEDDDLMHLRRVPLIKVDDETYINLISKSIKVSSEFLDIIRDKTQVFNLRSYETLNYACVFTNKENAFIMTFYDNGKTKDKSKFLINEELEIVDLSRKLKNIHIDYKIICNKTNKCKIIREDKVKLDKILKSLEYIKNNNQLIEYLTIEWFNKRENYNNLIKDIKKNYTKKHDEFLEILSLVSINNNV